MYVTKRDGRHEAVQFDKITARIKKLVSEAKRGDGCVRMQACLHLHDTALDQTIDRLTD